MVINDQDGVAAFRRDGSTLILHVDGSSEVQNPVVNRIEIDNALLIKDYCISPALGAESHVISFEGGGVFAYLRSHTGEVIEIRLSNGAYCRCDDEGHLIVFAATPPDVRARGQQGSQ